MHLRVGRVIKLSKDDCTRDRLLQFFCLCDGTFHTLRTVCQHKLCTICLQKLSAFYTHGLRQCQDCTIALCGCNGRNSDTCISGCRLDDCCPRLQLSLFLSILDHCKCNTILYRTGWVQVLQLYIQICICHACLLRITVCLKQWCITDQFQRTFNYFTHNVYLQIFLYFSIVFLFPYILPVK